MLILRSPMGSQNDGNKSDPVAICNRVAFTLVECIFRGCPKLCSSTAKRARVWGFCRSNCRFFVAGDLYGCSIFRVGALSKICVFVLDNSGCLFFVCGATVFGAGGFRICVSANTVGGRSGTPGREEGRRPVSKPRWGSADQQS